MAKEWNKDPDAILDYTVDWSDWLADGDEISTSTWTVATGITKVVDTKTATTCTIWLSGGSVNVEYEAACKITTTDGRTDERTITIRVRQR